MVVTCPAFIYMAFRIIISGSDCFGFVDACLQSILDAKGRHSLTIHVVDDGSVDQTPHLIKGFIKRSGCEYLFQTMSISPNMGAACARFLVIQQLRGFASDDDILVFVGLDDYLLPNALDLIAAEYERGAAVTYGNWLDHDTRAVYRFDTHENLAPGYWHTVPFFLTAPNTCKFALAKQLTAHDFIYEGKWLHTCTDVALMFALVRLADYKNVHPIFEPIYAYRTNTGNNSILRFGIEEKMRVANLIYKRLAI